MPNNRHGRMLAVAGMAMIAAMTAACTGAVEADAGSAQDTPRISAASDVEAGRYLIELGGCNDCHTPGYAQSNGFAPAEGDWLTGSPVGYAGPWGVSYASNLRLFVQTLDEDQFVELAHAGQGRPPMPWSALRAMHEEDARAIYHYLRWLGPKGEPAPAPIGPGEAITTPYFPFVPVMPE